MTKARKARKASGEELIALLEAYGIRNDKGTQLIAKILDLKPQSIRQFYSAGILRNDLKLLRWELADRRKKGVL